MNTSVHDRLAQLMTATTDCEEAYRLGVKDAFAMREIPTTDLREVAAKCAAKALTAHPQKAALPNAGGDGPTIMVRHGALD